MNHVHFGEYCGFTQEGASHVFVCYKPKYYVLEKNSGPSANCDCERTCLNPFKVQLGGRQSPFGEPSTPPVRPDDSPTLLGGSQEPSPPAESQNPT